MRGGGWRVVGGGWWQKGHHTYLLKTLDCLEVNHQLLAASQRGSRAGEADIVGGDVHLPKVTLAVEALPLAHAHL